jgi:hypothetical protein
MVTKKALNIWQNKLSESILTVAGGLRFGLSINPNSQIHQDAYDKAMYALKIVAGEVDIMFPNQGGRVNVPKYK